MLRRIALASLLLTLLTIDPASAGVTSTVEPATDLVDGQIVHLVVDGLPAQPGGSYVEIVQCRTPIADRATDCANFGPYRHVSPDGLLRANIAVYARLLLDGGTHDCRTGGCAFRVAVDGGPDVAALVPLDFDPSGPVPDPPSITAAPTATLVDGQRITVHGADLAPFDSVDVRECPVGAENPDCLRLLAHGFVDETGTFAAPIGAWAVLHPRNGVTTDCRVTTCELRVEVLFGINGPVALPLTFDPGGALLEPEVDVAPHTDLGPRQAVTVRLTGFHDLRQTVVVRQCLGRPGPVADVRQCDPHRLQAFEPAEGGVRLGTRRVITTAAQGEVDCSVRRCHVWTSRTLEAAALASERLTFRPRH